MQESTSESEDENSEQLIPPRKLPKTRSAASGRSAGGSALLSPPILSPVPRRFVDLDPGSGFGSADPSLQLGSGCSDLASSAGSRDVTMANSGVDSAAFSGDFVSVATPKERFRQQLLLDADADPVASPGISMKELGLSSSVFSPPSKYDFGSGSSSAFDSVSLKPISQTSPDTAMLFVADTSPAPAMSPALWDKSEGRMFSSSSVSEAFDPADSRYSSKFSVTSGSSSSFTSFESSLSPKPLPIVSIEAKNESITKAGFTFGSSRLRSEFSSSVASSVRRKFSAAVSASPTPKDLASPSGALESWSPFETFPTTVKTKTSKENQSLKAVGKDQDSTKDISAVVLGSMEIHLSEESTSKFSSSTELESKKADATSTTREADKTAAPTDILSISASTSSKTEEEDEVTEDSSKSKEDRDQEELKEFLTLLRESHQGYPSIKDRLFLDDLI